MLVAGIDEAGRGPCLGPMVLAVAVIEARQEQALLEQGVKDSKLLTAREREKHLKGLKKIVIEYSSILVQPKEIDELRDRKSLNEIEAMRAAQLLNDLQAKPDVVIIDSPDIIEGNFAKRLHKYLNFKTVIRAEHKADVNYAIVSAASIIAKTKRDAEIKKLARKHGNIGSGYPGDEVTINFIKQYLKKHKKLPSFARKSWDTSQRLLNERLQTKLF